ncbi:hypothetical protein [Halovivax gelatinilyticus]|uniref:hypothetical protein n=1 Tax=Halovivax gelatinilyticus TaxID=2961597 RepID=UPI0020CA81A6|nr:hypothetical protein [Halovivax gelatinilyticus]
MATRRTGRQRDAILLLLGIQLSIFVIFVPDLFPVFFVSVGLFTFVLYNEVAFYVENRMG